MRAPLAARRIEGKLSAEAALAQTPASQIPISISDDRAPRERQSLAGGKRRTTIPSPIQTYQHDRIESRVDLADVVTWIINDRVISRTRTAAPWAYAAAAAHMRAT